MCIGMLVVQVELSISFGGRVTEASKPLPGSLSSSPSNTASSPSTADKATLSPFTKASLPAVSKSDSPQFSAVRILTRRRQPSVSTYTAQTSDAVAENVSVIPITKDLPAAETEKSRARSPPRSPFSTVSEGNVTQVNCQSAGKTEEPLANISDIVNDSCTDNGTSPELPIVGFLSSFKEKRMPSRKTRVSSRWTRQGAKWYCPRKSHFTDDGEKETQAGPSVSDPARLQTSPDDVDSDYSPVFPLPPHITRSCTSLEFLESDGAKADSNVTGQTRKVTDDEGGIEKMSDIPDKPVSGQSVKSSASKSDEPEKPPVSRLRSISSESKSGIESSSEKVPYVSVSRQKSPEIMPSVEPRSDVPEESPVTSRVRTRSYNKSIADDEAHGKVLQSTHCVELPATSPEKFHPHPSNTESTVSSKDLDPNSQGECSQPKHSSSPATDPLISSRLRSRSSESKSAVPREVLQYTNQLELPAASPEKLHRRLSKKESTVSPRDSNLAASQGECSQLKQSGSPATDPPISGNICRISDDASLPTNFETKFSLKSSPISSPGGSSSKSGGVQPRRASFQLKVELQSPKSNRIKRLSSSTSSVEDCDCISRLVSPASLSTRRGRLSLASTPLQSPKVGWRLMALSTQTRLRHTFKRVKLSLFT